MIWKDKHDGDSMLVHVYFWVKCPFKSKFCLKLFKLGLILSLELFAYVFIWNWFESSRLGSTVQAVLLCSVAVRRYLIKLLGFGQTQIKLSVTTDKQRDCSMVFCELFLQYAVFLLCLDSQAISI